MKILFTGNNSQADLELQRTLRCWAKPSRWVGSRWI